MTNGPPGAEGNPLSTVEILTREHDTSHFDCGKAPLNDWLKRFAVANQQNDGHSAEP